MNPDTTLSNEQIAEIFRRHKLAQKPRISRVTTGFTNEVYQVDGYILKVYIRGNAKTKSLKESGLYKTLHGRVLVPELVVVDDSGEIIAEPYIIYKKIAGESLGNHWHELNDSQRKAIIKELCRHIKLISSTVPHPQFPNGDNWQEHMLRSLDKDLAKIKAEKLLPAAIQEKIKAYVDANKDVLKPQKLASLYWDVHLDNIIVDGQGTMVGLIDLEHVNVGSIDYVLDMVRQMMLYPQLTLSLEAEKFADKKDYAHLMDWYKEFYPGLFDFPNLEKRLDLYELEDVLRLLPRFPRAQQLRDRLAKLLN